MRSQCLAITLLLVMAMVLLATSTAQNIHFAGAGSTAQFPIAAIAADYMAINANNALYGGRNSVKHWTQHNGAYVTDNRDPLERIQVTLASVWLV